MTRFILSALLVILWSTVSAADRSAADFGVRADGTTDDGPAIQKALDEVAKSGGGRVSLNGASYRLDTPITIPSGVSLSGTWDGPHFPPQGTVILATAGRGEPDGTPLISLQPNATLRGVTVFYPNQKLEKGSVIPYPWTIQGRGTNGNVIDVTLVNPVKGIDFGTHPNELHYIRNVFGCPLQKGVFLDQTTDIGRVENVHFNPNFWARSGYPNAPTHELLIPFLGENCTAFEIGRSDWEFITNTFSFGCKVGYRFFESKAGPCNGNFTGIAADWARTAVLVEQTQPPGLLITNGQFVGSPESEAVVEIAASHTGVVQFTNSSFWGPHKRIASVRGTGRSAFQMCNFVQWDASNAGVPAIEAEGGSLDISHSAFLKPGPQILLGEDLEAVTIMGNQMTGPVRIDNRSGLTSGIVNNQSRRVGGAEKTPTKEASRQGGMPLEP